MSKASFRGLVQWAVLVTPVLCIPLLGQVHDAASIGPAEGSIAPAFSLSDQSGNPRTLDSLMGPKALVLVFFRSADW